MVHGDRSQRSVDDEGKEEVVMGIDACLTARRLPNVSAEQLAAALERETDELSIRPGNAFTWFTGCRFYEWENSNTERRIRITLEETPPELLNLLVDREILVYPDVAEYEDEDSWDLIKNDSMTIPVSLAGVNHDDPDIIAANAAENNQTVEEYVTMRSLMKFFLSNTETLFKFRKLAAEKDRDGMIAYLRSFEETAALVDTLISIGYIDESLGINKGQ